MLVCKADKSVPMRVLQHAVPEATVLDMRERDNLLGEDARTGLT